MQLVELLREYVDPTVKYWFHPGSSDFFQVSRLHGDAVQEDPERFGVALHPDVDIMTRRALQNGWVRLGVNPDPSRASYVEATDHDLARQAAKWLVRTFGAEQVHIDVKGTRPTLLSSDELRRLR